MPNTPTVSDSDPRGQHPDVHAFDPLAENAPSQPAASSSGRPVLVRIAGIDPGPDDDFHDTDTVLDTSGQDGDGDDFPPAGASAFSREITIRAPKGPLPPNPGFTVAAVTLDLDDDGEETFGEEVRLLSESNMKNERMARGLAHLKSLHPEQLPEPLTHIVVHDERGQEVYRRPILRVA